MCSRRAFAILRQQSVYDVGYARHCWNPLASNSLSDNVITGGEVCSDGWWSRLPCACGIEDECAADIRLIVHQHKRPNVIIGSAVSHVPGALRGDSYYLSTKLPTHLNGSQISIGH